jgi:hypothetical protein
MVPAPIIPMRDLAWAAAPVLSKAAPAAAVSALRRVNLDCMMASCFHKVICLSMFRNCAAQLDFIGQF